MGNFHLPKHLGNFRWKCLSVKNVFHSFPGFILSLPHSARKFKMAARVLMLDEIVELSMEEESLINRSDDDDIAIPAAVATCMRRDLHQNN